MGNTSATGGILQPAGTPAPPEDTELDAILQALVAGITALPGSLVRPRWQPVMPKQPAPDVDWCAIGVVAEEPDAGPYLHHNSDALGSTTSIRHEEIDVLASFYGPHSGGYAKLFRDGLGIPQNVEALTAQDLGFVWCGTIRTAPELVNQQWIRRKDMPVTFRCKTSRLYQIQNIVAADVHLFDDTTHVDDLITVPPGT
jgi:hypothetical protein